VKYEDYLIPIFFNFIIIAIILVVKRLTYKGFGGRSQHSGYKLQIEPGENIVYDDTIMGASLIHLSRGKGFKHFPFAITNQAIYIPIAYSPPRRIPLSEIQQVSLKPTKVYKLLIYLPPLLGLLIIIFLAYMIQAGLFADFVWTPKMIVSVCLLILLFYVQFKLWLIGLGSRGRLRLTILFYGGSFDFETPPLRGQEEVKNKIHSTMKLILEACRTVGVNVLDQSPQISPIG